MNFRQKIALSILPTLVLGSVAFAQVVEIPDPNLRAAVRDRLGLPQGQSITPAAMLQLTDLDADDYGIENLSGLEFAAHLRKLILPNNKIGDLAPLAGLRHLEDLLIQNNVITELSPLAGVTLLTHLNVAYNRIADISPLRHLTYLKTLNIRRNQISDISALSNLTRLELFKARDNRISDVTALTNLPRLEYLEIHRNRIFDHSPLDGLTLTFFTYDQKCDEPPRPLAPRLENRSFPSVFSAWGAVGWSPVLNQPHLSDFEQMAQHDLYWCCLQWDHRFHRVGDTWELRGHKGGDSMDVVFELNPNMIYLNSLGWDNADQGTYPPDSPYWRRDAAGEIIGVDFTYPGVQRDIIQQAVAIANCGYYDGIMLDFWGTFRYSPAEADALVAIVKGIRANTRDDFLIVGNTNDKIAPRTGAYINGLFLESGVPGKWDDPREGFRQLENTLLWAAENLREPQINALEGETFQQPLDSPANLRWMRAITTLSLTFSDSYALFAIHRWEGVHQHWHYWYDFWDADLGRPISAKFQLYQETDGLYIREYTNGWAVYNHSGTPQAIELSEEARGVASNWSGTAHVVPNLDGEIYLRLKPSNPADVNGDGVVNIFDLTIVAQAFQTRDGQGDVNGDGVINVFDLVFVANQF